MQRRLYVFFRAYRNAERKMNNWSSLGVNYIFFGVSVTTKFDKKMLKIKKEDEVFRSDCKLL